GRYTPRGCGGVFGRQDCADREAEYKFLISSGCASNAIIRSDMGRQETVVLYVVAMAAIIVGVDLAFFRSRFWERLAVNVGIVLVFGAFYWRFLRPP
ncbi:MAG: hypothetical protein WBL77_14645, partial [Pseudolabrys sp.]